MLSCPLDSKEALGAKGAFKSTSSGLPWSDVILAVGSLKPQGEESLWNTLRYKNQICCIRYAKSALQSFWVSVQHPTKKNGQKKPLPVAFADGTISKHYHLLPSATNPIDGAGRTSSDLPTVGFLNKSRVSSVEQQEKPWSFSWRYHKTESQGNQETMLQTWLGRLRCSWIYQALLSFQVLMKPSGVLIISHTTFNYIWTITISFKHLMSTLFDLTL